MLGGNFNRVLFLFIFLLSSLIVYGQAPPHVHIIQPINGAVFEVEQIKVDYYISVTEPKYARILVDERPVQLLNDIKIGQNTVMVDVPARDCKISIIVQNEFGASVPAVINLKRSENIFKPTLYVLAIGISKYANPDLHLQFAAKDAIDFAQAMLRQQGLLYEKVELKILTDGQAVAENIRSGLQWLQKETTYRDVVMLYMAGHGINNNVGNFFYMPVYADLSRINATCISGMEINETIKDIAGKRLVFLDACHSGNVLGNSQQRAAMLTQAINELTSADNGAIVFSSSTGRQFSLENPEWKNGAFTKALVEGLNGKADLINSKIISARSLDLYISKRVKELTDGQQSPTITIPESVPDFPLAVVTAQASLPSPENRPSSIMSTESVNVVSSSSIAVTKPAVTRVLTVKGSKVYDKFGSVPNAEIRSLMKNSEALYMFEKGKKKNAWGNTFIITGVGIMALGGMGLTNNPTDEENADFDKKENNKFFATIIGIGCTSTLIGIPIKISSKKFVRKSVEMYNNGVKSTSMEFQFGITGNGVGLALRF